LQLPAHIDVANARLPTTYEQARSALLHCTSIDECQEWANKAEALAAYARMAQDDTLRKLTDRIQARAVRRAGELLKLFDGRGRPSENNNGTVVISQATAAAKAGMSKRQKETAVRVANVPDKVFEAAVESEVPPSVTKLAEMGRQARPLPEGYVPTSHLLGTVKRFADFCRDHSPEAVAGDVKSYEVPSIRQHVVTIEMWLGRFVVKLRE
jgi:hypothetical protein